jgi:hypothetical protein
MDMGEHEELSKLLESSTEPEGITVQSADGRLSFLTKEDADRMAIPDNGLYTAFRSLKGHEPRKTERDVQANDCNWAWHWLENYSPYSARWRRVCLTYFETCVGSL